MVPLDAETRTRQRLEQDGRAAGASVRGLLERCDPNHVHRPLGPVSPGRTPLVVTLSGGGFRATLTTCGVLRFLADARLLDDVRAVSSVSGGSITNALFAVNYSDLADASFSPDAVDTRLVAPLLGWISQASLTRDLLLRAWRALGPATRTTILADELDRRWLGGARLDALPGACQFVFNAANLVTGARFAFDQFEVGDYIIGYRPVAGTTLRIATAAASSAAVPGAFAAVRLPNLAFPCDKYGGTKLVDGGAYDNLGLDAVDDHREAAFVVCNAGGAFRPAPVGGIPFVRDLQRSSSSLYKQSTGVRMRDFVERLAAYEDWRTAGSCGAAPSWGRRGVLFALGTTFTPAAGWTEPDIPDPLELVNVKTSFAKFPIERCERLVHRGWWLAGATLATYHPDLLPASLPAWRALPEPVRTTT